MPFDGNGNFAPPAADFPAVTGTVINSTKFNNIELDVAAGLSNCVTRDGQSPALANIPLGGYKLTGLGAATLSGDAVSLSANGGLTITGLSARFIAPFSGATATGRLLFQTSSVNSFTAVGVIPSGTATSSFLQVFGGLDPDNSISGHIAALTAEVQIAATKYGGMGTFPPLNFYTSGVMGMQLDASSNLAVNGFVTAGAVPFKSKLITGSMAAGSGGTVTVAHGLTASKILKMDVLVSTTTGAYVGPDKKAGFLNSYNAYFDATNITLQNDVSASEIYGRPYTAFITYTS